MSAVWIGLVTLLGLLILEVSLRLLFGFGNPLTYVADEQIGYLLTPNQTVRRFGNRIVINQYSMRSPPIASLRSAQTLRVLLLGDSVANGAWWTDQPDTISEQLQRQLQADAAQPVEVLNASANSWSPRNELAYLTRFGSFEAQVVILLINTDDLFGTAPTSIQIGRDRNYPNRKPASALSEVVFRYLLKPKPLPEMAEVLAEGGDRVGFNLAAIAQMHALVAQANGRLLLAITPLQREIQPPGSRDYEQKARQRLLGLVQQQAIDYLDFLPIFQAASEPLYRDHIHLSSAGNRRVSEALAAQVRPLLTRHEE